MADDQLAYIVKRIKIILSDLLGTFSDGRQAITVEPPEDKRRKSTTGLQCSIDRHPHGKSTRVSPASVFNDQYYKVTLINFDRSSLNLSEATRRMLFEFTQYKQPVHSPASDETYEQTTFCIYSPIFLSY